MPIAITNTPIECSINKEHINFVKNLGRATYNYALSIDKRDSFHIRKTNSNKNVFEYADFWSKKKIYIVDKYPFIVCQSALAQTGCDLVYSFFLLQN